VPLGGFGQRDKDGGLAESRYFKYGAGTCPGDNQVAGRIGFFELIFFKKGKGPITLLQPFFGNGFCLGLHLRVIFFSALVDYVKFL